ncbi:hypothetical protein BDV33DRAFT_201901 [Aspergillus novoparasiticus]|uniref:Uncharacterized protein n=1 Tax=Aspergillus novoparasiticus TaxID=986946 RepID=A0A5N6EZE9_9EURO|nr:hypothetical protein BDV33DRAFT_201901 [Aspergillus novoparasiticus]
MADAYKNRTVELETRFTILSTRFAHLHSTESQNQQTLQGHLFLTTQAALSATRSLARLIDGDFVTGERPAEMPSTLSELESTWKEAKTVGEKCYDGISSYSVEMDLNVHSIQVIQFHDAELRNWQTDMQTLKTELNESLEGTMKALKTEAQTLVTLRAQRAAAVTSLRALEAKLYEAKHKYDEADKWTWLWPPARAYLEILKPIIEAITNDVSGSLNAVKIAAQQVDASEARIRDQQPRVDALNRLNEDHVRLLSQGSTLANQCDAIRDEVEQMEKEIARSKTDILHAWNDASSCLNHAKRTKFSLSKADYATCVLNIITFSLNEHSFKDTLVDIVKILGDNDDKGGSVHAIKTDKHPEGLLEYVQKELQKDYRPPSLAVAKLNMVHSVPGMVLPSGNDLSPQDRRKLGGILNICKPDGLAAWMHFKTRI